MNENTTDEDLITEDDFDDISLLMSYGENAQDWTVDTVAEEQQKEVERASSADVVDARDLAPKPHVPAGFESRAPEPPPPLFEEVTPEPDPTDAHLDDPFATVDDEPSIEERRATLQAAWKTDTDGKEADAVSVSSHGSRFEDTDTDDSPITFDKDTDESSESSGGVGAVVGGVVDRVRGYYREHPKAKRPSIFGGAAAVVAVAVVALSGHDQPSARDVPHTAPTATVQPDAPSEPSAPQIQELRAVGRANCGPGQSAGQDALDGNRATAWKCPLVHGQGGVLDVSFGHIVTVTSARIVPGFDYRAQNGVDNWNRYKIVTDVLWTFPSDDTRAERDFPQKLSAARSGGEITFGKHGVKTDHLQVVLQKVVDPADAPQDAMSTPDEEDQDSVADIAQRGEVENMTAIPMITFYGYDNTASE